MNQIIIILNGNVKTLRGVTKIRFQADNDGDKYVEVYQGKKKTRFNFALHEINFLTILLVLNAKPRIGI